MMHRRNSWNSDYYDPDAPVRVKESDYGYITTNEANTGSIFGPGDMPNGPNSPPADDVLNFEIDGKSHRSCFPPYSISEGTLRVKDVRSRIEFLVGVSGETARNATITYKDQNLSSGADGDNTPVKAFGIKNCSCINVVIGKKSSKKNAGNSDESNGPPAKAEMAAMSPMEQLNAVESWFDKQLYPACQAFIKAPPADVKARDQEWRRLSETTMQHVTLKIDGVETNGDPAVRTRRKEITKRIGKIMEELDTTNHRK